MLQKYENIIQYLSGSTSLYFLEENSNVLDSITDIIGDHTEIHLLLKVIYHSGIQKRLNILIDYVCIYKHFHKN